MSEKRKTNADLLADLAAERKKSRRLQAQVKKFASEREQLVAEYTRAKDGYVADREKMIADYTSAKEAYALNATAAGDYRRTHNNEVAALAATIAELRTQLGAARACINDSEEARAVLSKKLRALTAKPKPVAPVPTPRRVFVPLSAVDDEFSRTIRVG